MPAEYYRKYRATHPAYRKRELERVRERREVHGRGDRSKEYERRKHIRLRQNADHGHLAESSLIRRARAIASSKRRPDRRTVLWDDTHEELVSEVVLALCEQRDPGEAMHAWLKNEWQHRFYRAELFDER